MVPPFVTLLADFLMWMCVSCPLHIFTLKPQLRVHEIHHSEARADHLLPR